MSLRLPVCCSKQKNEKIEPGNYVAFDKFPGPVIKIAITMFLDGHHEYLIRSTNNK